MKKLRLFALGSAVLFLAGLMACQSSGTKEVKEEVKEEVEQVEEKAPCSDSTHAHADSVVVDSVAEEVAPE